MKCRQLQAVSRTQQGRHREPSVKTLRSPLYNVCNGKKNISEVNIEVKIFEKSTKSEFLNRADVIIR